MEFSLGHSAFGAGVTVTIVEASNVGVKVGMVGRGVIVAVGDSVGILVFVGLGDGVAVPLLTIGIVAVGVTYEVFPHEVRKRIPPSRLSKIGFNVFLPNVVRYFRSLRYSLNGIS